MNRFFLTLDLEEWYHLDYLKDDGFEKKDIMLYELDKFFSILDKYDIKITVFVLGELLENHSELVQFISQKGHEIAIHGWNHDLLYHKTDLEFKDEITKAKLALEELTLKKVIGYRASCFSLDNNKLEILKNIGLKYDSSYIQFAEHPLYGKLDISNFKKIDDLIYEDNGFFEFELATFPILNKNIPISGGGYFRLFPFFIFKKIWNKYLKNHHNYIMYIHPFELTDKKVNLKNISWVKKFRFCVGRKTNLDKLDKFIGLAKNQGFEFLTISNYLNSLNK